MVGRSRCTHCALLPTAYYGSSIHGVAASIRRVGWSRRRAAQGSEICLDAVTLLRKAVAAELLQPGIGERDRQHRLPDDPSGGHHADVAALVTRDRHVFAGAHIHGGPRVGEGPDWVCGPPPDPLAPP